MSLLQDKSTEHNQFNFFILIAAHCTATADLQTILVYVGENNLDVRGDEEKIMRVMNVYQELYFVDFGQQSLKLLLHPTVV